ncbi:MAG: helix-turn-helix domain-containing protein [Thermodesulfobacteriota bacterium]
MRYPWPGNVRELENAVERAVILVRGDMITPEDLPDVIRIPDPEDESIAAPSFRPGKSLKEMEKEMILQTLRDTDGNRTRTAEILGISRRTLQMKLKAYGENP